jgi:hypothetical protein
VGKISNETNRVGNENPGLRLGVQRSHGGIQGRKEQRPSQPRDTRPKLSGSHTV